MQRYVIKGDKADEKKTSISPWCVKHDERVLVALELALEGLVGELQDILFVGVGAEYQE